MSHTKIGCEVIIRKGDTILLGKRGKAAFGTGTWALPGGHLELQERLVDAICRELKEELDADVAPSQLTLVSIVDDLNPKADTHYVHMTFELLDPQFEPKLMEPESCDEWRYYPLNALPENFFMPHKGIILNYLAQRLYLM
jgi:8-oxo-dGTP diphosphatase